MNHSYNIKAFLNPDKPESKLAKLYMALVAVELALKDKIFKDTAEWKKGHSVVTWINETVDSSKAQQLNNLLSAIYCTAKDGTQSIVTSDNYPVIRYMRHETDFTGTTPESLLDDSLTAVNEIVLLMRQKGIMK